MSDNNISYELVISFILGSKTNEELKKINIVEEIEDYKPILRKKYNFQTEEHFLKLREMIDNRLNLTQDDSISLTDTSDKHDIEWYKTANIQYNYWKNYETLLKSKGFSASQCNDLDRCTKSLLGLCGNPDTDNSAWERKGLVIGNVQSGKTQHYTGLITKAADAGYKFIIILTGTINELRVQTQKRLEEGFIGLCTETRKAVGVGEFENHRMPESLTNIYSDFNKKHESNQQSGIKAEKCTIMIVKKNVTTLKNIQKWLKELNTKENQKKITVTPILLIDDEADYASVNTKSQNPDAETDPTQTNKRIREILEMFTRKTYIGYTATPFANIFINPEQTKQEMLGSDLFPKDFIHLLMPPSNYLGYEKIFSLEDVGDSEDAIDDKNNQTDGFLRVIQDMEEYLPLNHKRHNIISSDNSEKCPQSLKKAIKLFIIARCIRNLMGDKDKHCSMFINVSRFIDIQKQIRDMIYNYIDKIKNPIRYGDKSIIEDFKNDFESEYKKNYEQKKISWIDVQQELSAVLENIDILTINSKHDKLDYSKDNIKTIIAVGGLSLSRGLTIEGLIISYLYRDTKAYDTLMQMGRWFGYREGYEKLCRICLSDALIERYRYIAEATDDLKNQIRQMKIEGKTPSDFGLYVKTSPDGLRVTAYNKMRTGQRKTIEIGFSNKRIETYIVSDDIKKQQENKEIIFGLYQEMSLEHSQSSSQENTEKHYFYSDINYKIIIEFMQKIHFHEDMKEFKDETILSSFIDKISSEHEYWDIVFLSKGDNSDLVSTKDSSFVLRPFERKVGYYKSGILKKPNSDEGYYIGTRHTFASPSSFAIGLSNDKKQEAKEQTDADKIITPEKYTHIRQKPIMIIQLINLLDNDKNIVIPEVTTLSICFPSLKNSQTVEVYANQILVQHDDDTSDEDE